MKLTINSYVKVPLYVTGHKGDVTQQWPSDKPLPTDEATQIAYLEPGGGTDHRWGWVYLGTAPGRFEYQIYHETQRWGGNYAFFGWYDANSTHENSNPSPFPAGVATADTDGTYVLLRDPPR